MDRCERCGQILPWPHVKFTPLERRVWDLILETQPRSAKEGARMLRLNEGRLFQKIVDRVRAKLPNRVEIHTRPFRVVRLVPVDEFQPDLLE